MNLRAPNKELNQDAEQATGLMFVEAWAHDGRAAWVGMAGMAGMA